jgi:Tol biopolymer transport system component/DNA-binding winged helix-turn-helix (wHTH) protein
MPMASQGPARLPRIASFADFELDLENNVLRKRGRGVRLQHLPARMLILLVSHAGEIVTREQLRNELWPEGTFVAFDAGLNTAIRKVRQALDDDSGRARYIETIPREGYRFIAPVRLPPPGVLAPANVLSFPTTVLATPPAPTGVARLLWICLGVAFLVVATAGAWIAGRLAQPRPLVATVAQPLDSLEGSKGFPAISPDGSQVAFSWDGLGGAAPGIYVTSIRGGEPRLFTPATGHDISPVWSPDGTRMTFRRWTGLVQAVMVAPVTGGAPRQLAETDGYFVAWTPDSQSVLFTVQSKKASGFELWSVPAGGGEPRQIPTPRGLNPYDRFGYSPDGTMLAYETWPSSSEEPQIMVRSANGATARQVTTLHSRIYGWTWTPDSRGFVISNDSQGSKRLYEVSLDSPKREPVPIAGAAEDAEYPAMAREIHASSDQFALVYVNPRRVCNFYGASLAWNREGVPRLTAPPSRFLASTRVSDSPQISPDGRRMVFISNRSGFQEIWLAGVTGTNPVQLTHFASPEHKPGSARWSPDSSQLVFDVEELRIHHIYVLSIEGGAMRQLTEGADDTVRPSWSRNGQWIYMGSQRTGRWEIWRIPVEAGGKGPSAAKRMEGSSGFEGFETPDGSALLCGEHGQLWRVPVDGGPPSLLVEKGVWNGWWAFAPGGIIYADLTPQKTGHPGDLPVLFYSFRTHRATALTSLPQRVVDADPGLTVSPDGRYLVLDRIEDESTNLVLVSTKR